MSLPLSSQPLSSLLPGLEHTDSISSITPSIPSTTEAPHFPYSWSQGHNRRFSLLGKFPNNVRPASYIPLNSSCLTRVYRPPSSLPLSFVLNAQHRLSRSAMPLFSNPCLMALFQGDEPEAAHQVGVSGYADLFFRQPSLAMSPGSPPEEERLSRKSKSENRVCCCFQTCLVYSRAYLILSSTISSQGPDPAHDQNKKKIQQLQLPKPYPTTTNDPCAIPVILSLNIPKAQNLHPEYHLARSLLQPQQRTRRLLPEHLGLQSVPLSRYHLHLPTLTKMLTPHHDQRRRSPLPHGRLCKPCLESHWR
jgi:hypothetical protein